MFRIGNHYFPKSISFLLFAELAVLLLSVYAGAKIRFFDSLSLAERFPEFVAPALVFAGAMIFSMSALGMYQAQLNTQLKPILLRLAPACALGFSIITAVFYLAPSFQVGRGILGLMFGIACCGLLATRLLFFKSAHSGMFVSRALFLGTGQLARDCAWLAQHHATSGKYYVAGFIAVGDEETRVPGSQVFSRNRSLFEMAQACGASDIVVAVQNKRGVSFPIQELLECKLNGIRVIDSAHFFESEACQIRVNTLQPSWLVFGGGFDQSFARAFCKRGFDLVVSLAVATVTSPIMALTALAIWLEDRGPILYSQERVGRGGRTYMVHKFRSMRTNAEQAGQPQWAQQNDPRVTRVGAFIRKVRIDELPQVFNVLVGEMSFVGPRPERPFFVRQFAEQIPYYDVRHSIKPGITGMAQVRYPYGASLEDAVQKLQYDLYYVKNNSLFLDLLILIDTVRVVVLGKGAR
ncbi:TIGR03013 family PEP-CTERM/XrtA system glycosyltransferase [Oxalobacteraceae bacterium OM1]|nr:TIGR03013 family PEP-CTERM/XrtA system glycosyltransferase [Oxalobacteraceae bacterium OM1]